jgi:pilus assembly protein CpaC
MNIVVSPEVSSIDRSQLVTINGLNVPGLSVRRATTTVELRDGQSFAIAGLLQSNFSDGIRQLPWVGDIPILGALFRSSEYQRDETELMIIVTPHLVKPAPAGTLATPVDNFIPPNNFDLFLMGRLEDAKSGMPGARATGGIAGQFGHIIK